MEVRVSDHFMEGEWPMALTQRIESLKARHAEIEAQLHAEESRPAQDETKIQHLKKEKLTLKDELSKLLEAQEKAA